MKLHQSLLLVISGTPAVQDQATKLIDRFGWRCKSVLPRNFVVNTFEELAPDAVLIDSDSASAASIVATVRQLPAPANGTPIFIAGTDPVDVPGAGALLVTPIDEQALCQALEHWVGPLSDHALRQRPASPRYKLIRLLGFTNAEGMLTRFRETLVETLKLPREDLPAHRLAGLAGMVGYAELSGFWSAVEAGRPGALEIALAATQRVLEDLA